MSRPNGLVLYRGPSMIDGEPIVAIATGLASSSANRKTGSMVQTWIMRADVDPIAALRSGSDQSVCGDCPRRSVASGGDGACYVNVGQAPLAVWEAWTRDIYPIAFGSWQIESATAGRMVRIGSYGDPAAVPVSIWRSYVRNAIGWTGYTHQWRNAAELRGLCMASCDSVTEALEAQRLGWRSFRVTPKGVNARLRGEAICPASAEAGYKRVCETCPIRCAGTSAMHNVVIQAHGSKAARIQ